MQVAYLERNLQNLIITPRGTHQLPLVVQEGIIISRRSTCVVHHGMIVALLVINQFKKTIFIKTSQTILILKKNIHTDRQTNLYYTETYSIHCKMTKFDNKIILFASYTPIKVST